ncbi:MAG: hypothetical protein AB7R55_01485 [Gemmatimonadales bacterium]
MSNSRLRVRSSLLLAAGLGLAAPGAAQTSRTSSSPTSALIDSTARAIVATHAVHRVLAELAAEVRPKGLSARDSAEWERQTEAFRTAERSHRSFLARLDQRLKSAGIALGLTGSIVPGATVLSAALSGALGGGGGGGGGSGGDGGDLLETLGTSNIQMLRLEQSLGQTTRSLRLTSAVTSARQKKLGLAMKVSR